jgi:hypothetical protein
MFADERSAGLGPRRPKRLEARGAFFEIFVFGSGQRGTGARREFAFAGGRVPVQHLRSP